MDKSLGCTVFGVLGATKDSWAPEERWNHWRPSVALCQHEDLLVRRFELIHDARFHKLADQVEADIKLVSPETEVCRNVIDLSDPWDFQEVFEKLYAFMRSYSFDPECEDYLVHMTTGTHVVQICMYLLAESRHIPARLIQTSPPRRRQDDVRGTFQVIDLDLSRYDLIARRFATEHDEGVSLLKSGIETLNRDFNRQIDQIEKVAKVSREPMLLMGPTGAGKSQLGARIYELKKQRHQLAGDFIEVNCATLRGDTATSTLFGHKRGAFTGAAKDRPGLLLAADKGLLFLDEIGELGLDEQAMLLRALEEKRFLPVGSDTEVTSDFQLIAGTNRDLHHCVVAGAFREDLLARINLWTFHLPGLRDRIEDLEPNIDYELERFAQQTSRRVSFNREARERYLRFATSADASWAGNFRDLNASVVRMGTLAPGGRINVAVVDEEVARLRATWRGLRQMDASGRDLELLADVLGEEGAEGLDLFDRVQLASVVQACRSARSLSDAGRRLFSESRKAKKNPNDADRLRKYLARFDLTFRDLVGEEGSD